MPLYPFDSLLALLLTALLFGLLVERAPFRDHPAPPKAPRRGPRLLRPHTPDDCALCRTAATSSAPAAVVTLIPCSQIQSSRGRKKSISTASFASPYKAQVLHAVAEGLSAQAAARVFHVSETTVRSWVSRAGQHSQSLHQRLMRTLQLTHVQLDELRLKLRGATEPAWLWVACDARTKIIPVFALGPRTQAMAHQLVHEVAQRLAPGCLPIFSSDGLALYFFAVTAHFAQWTQALSERRRVWTVNARLLYGQVTPHLRRVQVSNGTPAPTAKPVRVAGAG